MSTVSTRPKPALSTRSPAVDALVSLGFMIGTVALLPAFTLQLAFDETSQNWTPSPVLQTANTFCGIFALVIIFRSREALHAALRCWPILLLAAMPFISTLWSLDPRLTMRKAGTFLTATLFSLAVVSWYSPEQRVRFVTRAMTLVCAISIIWVFFFPRYGAHQLADAFQTVHRGLWRGIFSHKNLLGYFAGLTTALLLFFGSLSFRSLIIRIGAIFCSTACLVGSRSGTGFGTCAILTVMLFMVYWISRGPIYLRRPILVALILFLTGMGLLYSAGLLDFIPYLLGKSADLTGRLSFWPYVLQAVQDHGSPILGYGYSSPFVELIIPEIAALFQEYGVSVDNGYIDLIIQFGYAGTLVIVGMFAWFLTGAVRVASRTSSQGTITLRCFPFAILVTIMFVNVTESNFLEKNIGTTLLAIAVSIIQDSAVKRRSPVVSALRPPVKSQTRRYASMTPM